MLSVVWFCYLLLTFCIIDVAFNGSPSNRQSTLGLAQIEFASSWDLRIQFYPLSILIALPTLPFVYLLTKIFKSDILVCYLSNLSLLRLFFLLFFKIDPVYILGWISNHSSFDHYTCHQYYCTHDHNHHR